MLKTLKTESWYQSKLLSIHDIVGTINACLDETFKISGTLSSSYSNHNLTWLKMYSYVLEQLNLLY
jgi:hypothetical protein